MKRLSRDFFPKVKLSVCPHEIQNFGNLVTDISILRQFRIYLQFRGEKYLNTFVVTNANDCPNLFTHGATFRMGVLLPNYPEENVVKGENVPNLRSTHLQLHLQMSSRSCKIMTETVQRPVPFPYHAHRLGKSTLYCAKTVQRAIPFRYCAQYHTSSVRTVLFQYRAHRFEKNIDHGTAHGTTDDFFQDHHTFHSYDWKNDNKTDQSSTHTSRNFM